jgi:CDP-glucose 4,6-dehydratase
MLQVRNPDSTRPWQHVLDCLYGYLLAANQMMRGEQREPLEIYNFGPEKSMTVQQVLEILRKQLAFNWERRPESSVGGEHNQLSLNSHKAGIQLGWECQFDGISALEETASWYKNFITGTNARILMRSSIERFFTNEE